MRNALNPANSFSQQRYASTKQKDAIDGQIIVSDQNLKQVSKLRLRKAGDMMPRSPISDKKGISIIRGNRYDQADLEESKNVSVVNEQIGNIQEEEDKENEEENDQAPQEPDMTRLEHQNEQIPRDTKQNETLLEESKEFMDKNGNEESVNSPSKSNNNGKL